MNRKLDLALTLAGFAIFVFAVSRIGIHNLLRQTTVLRIGLPLIMLLSAARLVLQTVSWNIALRTEGIEASAAPLMMVRLASQGVGYLTILGPVASEPMKIRLIGNRPNHADDGSATTATLVDTGVYWIASGLAGIAGCIAAGIVFAGVHRSLMPMVGLAVFFSLALMVIARATSPLARLTGALGERCPKWLLSAARIDTRLRDFANFHPDAIRRMFALDLLCQALVAGEVAAVFWSLRLPLHVTTVLGLEAGTRMVKILAGFMPARIGADEGGAAAAFVAFGLPAASGLAMALARRARDLLACLIGLIWLASQPGFAEMRTEMEK